MKTEKKYHDNGNIKEEYQVNDEGVRHGATKLYHENGQLQVEVHCTEGIQDSGKVVSYHDNGAIAREVFLDNKIGFNGEFFEWYDNGAKKIIGNYQDNELHGSYKEFHENGNLKIVANYKNGVLNGNTEEYDNKGRIKQKRKLINNKVLFYSDKGLIENEFIQYKDVNFIENQNSLMVKLSWLHNIGPIYCMPGKLVEGGLIYNPPKNQEDSEYVNIIFSEESKAVKFIDFVISLHGGESNFKQNSTGDYKYAFQNKLFHIGYLDLSKKFNSKVFAVDIDRLSKPSFVLLGRTDKLNKDSDIDAGVNTYNDYINQIIKGLNGIIYNIGHLSADCNFYFDSASEKILFYWPDYSDAIQRFKSIINYETQNCVIRDFDETELTLAKDYNLDNLKITEYKTLVFENDNFKAILGKGNSNFYIYLYLKVDLPQKNEIRRTYHHNGSIKEEFELKNGILNGNYYEYDSNGKLKLSLNFKDGKI